MDCNNIRHLIEAYVDGELDVVHQLEVEAHLKTCTTCAALAENAKARRQAITSQLPRFAAPASLQMAVRASLREESSPSTPIRSAAARKPSANILYPIWRVAGVAASVALALFVGYGLGIHRAENAELFNEAIADHVRSLQAEHLMDVVSTDQHTVKPWFAGKLPFSPPVVDLASDGFPLAGGRLEHMDDHTAAGLVYRRRKHAVNVFIWPATDNRVSDRLVQRDGFSAKSWSHGDLNFIAVSEIPESELTEFVSAYQAATR